MPFLQLTIGKSGRLMVTKSPVTLLNLALLFSSLVLVSSCQDIKPFHDPENIWEVETEYSKASLALGFGVATLRYAADDALVFRPTTINAKVWAEQTKAQDAASVISWHPSFIEMAQAGDLGYAVGPFEIRPTKPGENQISTGEFATVWKRQKDGSLKFIMDFGSGVLPAFFIRETEPAFDPSSAKQTGAYKAVDIGKEFEKLMAIENEFSNAFENAGDAAAYEKYAARDIRFFYQREFYYQGLDKVLNELKNRKGKHAWTPQGGTLSESGDLAHVYGTHRYTEAGSVKTGYYMRVWRKQDDGKWVIALQVRNIAGP